ncbi:MAG: serine/threonine protein kinase [Deltaproteobacteria bacterium]|nr:MAG: serine/threonine protein kinase [Deltaproteobacteria bacterium]
MASSNGPHDKDVKFEDSFRRYLKRSDLRSPVPDSLMAQLKRDTPLHPTASADKDTLLPREVLTPDDESGLRPDTQQALSQWSSKTLEGSHLQGIYRLERRIAKGGMAWVYKGWHENLKVPVAVKLLYPELVEEPELYQRFLNEARMLAQLRHSNIVQVYDVLEEQNMLGMVLEWIEGVDLFAWQTQQSRPASLHEIKTLFLPILDAMHYIHEQGIVHRDIKPDNILMHQNGEVWVPKVADFGIAKMKDQLGRVRTRTGISLGTPMYMSPEQIRDSKNVDARADIYSLGVVLFEWLTGHLPFEGDDSWVFYQHMHESPPPLHDFCSGIPDALNTIVLKFLEKDPSQRFATCHEAAEALSKVCEEFGELQPVPLKTPRRAARRPQLTTTSQVSTVWFPWVLLALALLLGLGWWGWSRSQRSQLVDSGAPLQRQVLEPQGGNLPVAPQSSDQTEQVVFVLRTLPEKVEVWQNDKLLGLTPYRWVGKPGDSGAFVLRLKGYNPRAVSLTLTSEPEQGRTWELSALLRPNPRNVRPHRKVRKRSSAPHARRSRVQPMLRRRPSAPRKRSGQEGPPQGSDLDTMMTFPHKKPKTQPHPRRRSSE